MSQYALDYINAIRRNASGLRLCGPFCVAVINALVDNFMQGKLTLDEYRAVLAEVTSACQPSI